MNVTVRYFASLREALGSGEALEVASGESVGGLRDCLMRRSAVHAAVLDRKRALRCALNQALCEESALVLEGAEVAFFPPVTGG
ncbi:MAG: MoaD/ThiS family protein [Burkholderiaceae bacterium]